MSLDEVAKDVQKRLERLEIRQASIDEKLNVALTIATGIFILVVARSLGVG